MTWSVVRRLLAADGGFGAMYRDLGAKPDPALGSLSAFDLVADRPMMNLSRLPRMQFAAAPSNTRSVSTRPIHARRSTPNPC